MDLPMAPPGTTSLAGNSNQFCAQTAYTYNQAVRATALAIAAHCHAKLAAPALRSPEVDRHRPKKWAGGGAG